MKRKGFTLIELLAVIVILAVIALISIPMILNTVEKSKEGAAKVSAENYLDAVEKYIAIQEIDNYEIKLEKNKIYKVEEETNYEIEGEVDNTLYLNNVIKIKGEYPSDGYIKIEEKITYAEFTINNYLIECNESGICEVVGKQDGKEIKVKSIEINEIDESKISIGGEIQLSATILPKGVTKKKVTWTSSNEEVATVSETGLLKIIGYGDVTITAKTSNNKVSEKNINIQFKIKEIAAGSGFSIVTDNSNTLWGWGSYNSYGQLGNNNTSTVLSPIKINTVLKFSKISSRQWHSIAIDTEGNLWAWGRNDYGQLGNGTTTNSSVPVQIKSDKKFKEASTGYWHSLAIDTEGNLWTWGYNGDGQYGYGQLGNGTKTYSSVPIQIMSGTKFKIISAGYSHSLAIDTEGNLWTWGSNKYGQLGNDSTTDSLIPIQIMSGTKFKSVSAGYWHSLAVDAEGNLWSWGWNGYGDLGNGTTTTSKIPIQIKSGTKFKSISAGNSHNLAIDDSGNLWAWGKNDYGQLGNGTTTKSLVPIQIISGTKFISISAGDGSSLAIDESGNLWGIGYIESGVTKNNTSSINTPIKVDFNI